MFLKWRIKRAKNKMEKTALILDSINTHLKLAYNEKLGEYKVKTDDKLALLTWKYIKLDQKLFQSVGKNFRNYIGFTSKSKKPCSLAKIHGKEKPESHPKTLASIYVTLDKFDKRITRLEKGRRGITPEDLNKALNPKMMITLTDLDKMMKDKMAEVDSNLQGDLALLLHKLRDPVNHPVSLLEMACDVASGKYSEPELVATALDMLVDEYREKIGPKRDFEMSDRACLEALDKERNILC